MGKVYSQNGYEAKNSSLIAAYTIPGTKVKINLRKGDVSVVILDFLSWYNDNIEPLRQSDTGGYNPRSIIGSSTLSNHASGTATDARWQDHPLGVRGTFSASEKRKINAKLAEYDGVIRWGENYSGRIDGMHYEINKGPAAVKKAADKIRAKVPTKVTYTHFEARLPNIPFGHDDRNGIVNSAGKKDTTWYVQRVQRALEIPDDGRFGDQTKQAIRARIKGHSGNVIDFPVWQSLDALWGAKVTKTE
jgi:hypothetical protein